MSNNENNNNNQSEIPLKLSKILEESGIIEKFVIDSNDKYVKLRLNTKYDPPIALDVSIDIIIKEKKGGWEKFANRFRDLRKTFKKISEDHKDWIYSTINENGDLIRRIARLTNNLNNNSTTNSSQQEQNQNNESDVSDKTTAEENTTLVIF